MFSRRIWQALLRFLEALKCNGRSDSSNIGTLSTHEKLIRVSFFQIPMHGHAVSPHVYCRYIHTWKSFVEMVRVGKSLTESSDALSHYNVANIPFKRKPK